MKKTETIWKHALPVAGKLLKCNSCKKKILVEKVLMGIDHDAGIYVTCWGCLPIKSQQCATDKYQLDSSDEDESDEGGR